MSNSRFGKFHDVWFFHLLAIVLLVLLVVIAVVGFDAIRSVKLNDELQLNDYSTLFANVLVITIIVERFLEVFNAIWRRKGKLQLTRKVQDAKNDESKKQAQEQLDSYRARTQTLAMYSGFVIGILAGIAGVRTLEIIFDFSSLTGTQETLFHSIDILLTAGLIAGGSKGINAVTRVIGNFLESTKDKATQLGEPSPDSKPKA
jgi:hypothetical protein